MTDNPFDSILIDERISLLAELARSLGVQAYLVGGALRDAVMGRPVRDYDFALGGAVCELPREFAVRSGGKFFWLDRERQQSRVVTCRAGERLTFDFGPIRGGGIDEDLRLRDFTVNALALSLVQGERGFIDPLGGMDDIRTATVLMCGPEAFSDDPLRMLRAFRFAATLGFSVEFQTLEAVRSNPVMLDQVAGERVRDEFFLILGAPEVGRSLESLHQSGLLSRIIPELPDPPWGIALAASVERVAGEIDRLFPEDGPLLPEHLQRPVEGDVPVLSLVKLAALLAGEEWEKLVRDAVSRLKLGNKAREALRALCGCLADFPTLPETGLTERPCYRFFRDRQPCGAEMLLLPLAKGAISLKLAERMLSFYFHRFRPDEGDLLLSGDDVMALLHIPQGLELGRQMERLREAESLGLVATAEEAREFLLKNQLTKQGSPG
jgi:poly(A) polymerase